LGPSKNNYIYDISNRAYAGGVGGWDTDLGVSSDPISDVTAFLYLNFLAGGSGFSGIDFQHAIWDEEEEKDIIGGSAAANLLAMAQREVAGGWRNNGKVQVMNLYYGDGHTKT